MPPDALITRLKPFRAIGPDRPRAEDALADCLASEGGADLATLLASHPDARDLVIGIAADSPYLRDLMFRDAARLTRALTREPLAAVDELLAGLNGIAASEPLLMSRLRRTKQDVALILALADLGQVLDVMTITRAMTALADCAVSAAARFLLAEANASGQLHLPDPDQPEQGSGWIFLAMGKHGAGELNYSSDIDLIVLFDPVSARDPDNAQTLFVRMTRRLVRILEERTADGYVFRTDLRLRPDPGATAIAINLLAAMQYYESMGQNWERAAMIKARPCAGDIAAGNAYLVQLRPYVWRKYLDYAAIRDIHSIKRQIHAHKGHGRVAVAGHNVKLGRGGIREIEFFVQTQQLIAGGRAPDLRGRETLAMLDGLTRQGWMSETVRGEMAEAYRFLRNVEHRIQMLADEQTHTLPDTPEGLARIGRMMGFQGADDFAEQLTRRLTRVSAHYADLFEEEDDLSGGVGNMVFTGDDDDPATLDTLRNLGFERPEEVTRAIRAWHFGRYAATRSTRAREILTEITPRLITALAETDAADQAFLAFDALIERLPAGVQLFSMLSENRALLSLLATIMGTAPRLANLVAKRPHVMDAVIEPAFFGTIPSREEVARRFDLTLGEARGFEDLLDRARIFGQEQMFLIGVRILSGTISATQAGEAFASLADVLLARLLLACLSELERQHGRISGGKVALIAMGKLGGREMTAASDLDLILLYDHDPDAVMSDGPRPLSPAQFYARLTQRLVTALTAPTAEGQLYDVDLRLRPSGNAGPLATRLDAFVRYQDAEAWTWEFMALTRARVVAATGGFETDVKAAITSALARPRDPAKIYADIADMRARIEGDKGVGDRWDLKIVPGGLVDLEFIAQGLQLVHGAAHPALFSQTTEIVLRQAADLGLLAHDDAAILTNALRLYQSLTQLLRLSISGRVKPDETPGGFQKLLLSVAASPSIPVLDAELTERQAEVRAIFERLIGQVARRTDGE